MLVENAAVKVALEIEVAAYQNGYTNNMVVAELLNHPNHYMMGTAELWDPTHPYGCKCKPGGCGIVRSGDLIDPPLVSLTYDGSLPKTGGEWVTSPILLAEHGLEDLKEVWEIITTNAEWRNDLANYHDNGMCSPSVHIHVSANTGRKALPDAHYGSDIVHALTLFAPEFLALASSCETMRSLEFRQPVRKPDDRNGHHGMVHLREAIQDSMVYIEWRMFEAAYRDWEYLEGAAYIASTITRAFLNQAQVNAFLGRGASLAGASWESKAYGGKMGTEEFINTYLSRERLSALKELCLTQINDDERGYAAISNIFERTERLYGV